MTIYIYIYIYVRVCVCVCVLWHPHISMSSIWTTLFSRHHQVACHMCDLYRSSYFTLENVKNAQRIFLLRKGKYILFQFYMQSHILMFFFKIRSSQHMYQLSCYENYRVLPTLQQILKYSFHYDSDIRELTIRYRRVRPNPYLP